MRAGAGFNAEDLVFVEDALERALDLFGVFGGDDVVGDDQRLVATLNQDRGDHFDDGSFTGADRAANTNTGNLFHRLFLGKCNGFSS